ncbi:MAG: hypothetical protein J0M33_29665 [Anaerolineae bacterium]|nr:hypothetical protein [Anaerolineae bacterium]
MGEILGIWTDESWLYPAALLDTYARFIQGWAMSIYRDEALVTDALRMALGRRDLPPDSRSRSLLKLSTMNACRIRRWKRRMRCCRT